MKKRSMLAIASLATGFVVAAVTPSHAVGENLKGVGLNSVDVDKTLSDLQRSVATKNLDLDHAKKKGFPKKKGK
ncbi:hypothetical protein [Streptomyces sp. S.PNR 29]|uniref:hypothetical protein n=1 Tax=Streptomyces sp. S.PNR 29 TaxID=2973805 RepID=UPI0025AF60B4|nr:hypothetical protein [Streptomyces sp. S.PNR 29]MDN0196466.1 hypothetical protein [Streptomyces sp. S.PNR 29]